MAMKSFLSLEQRKAKTEYVKHTSKPSHSARDLQRARTTTPHVTDNFVVMRPHNASRTSTVAPSPTRQTTTIATSPPRMQPTAHSSSLSRAQRFEYPELTTTAAIGVPQNAREPSVSPDFGGYDSATEDPVMRNIDQRINEVLKMKNYESVKTNFHQTIELPNIGIVLVIDRNSKDYNFFYLPNSNSKAKQKSKSRQQQQQRQRTLSTFDTALQFPNMAKTSGEPFLQYLYEKHKQLREEAAANYSEHHYHHLSTSDGEDASGSSVHIGRQLRRSATLGSAAKKFHERTSHHAGDVSDDFSYSGDSDDPKSEPTLRFSGYDNNNNSSSSNAGVNRRENVLPRSLLADHFAKQRPRRV